MTAASNASSLVVTSAPLPASRKVYQPGTLHPHISVPMRAITLHPSAKESDLIVYDSSGPYTDAAARIAIESGLPRLREQWITARQDVEQSVGHGAPVTDFPVRRASLRARSNAAVTQLAYARAGIITPEMEFVAIRENVGRAQLNESARERRPLVGRQHS